MRLPLLVEVRRAELGRVARAELEDVPHLDDTLDQERRPAGRTGVARLGQVEVGVARREVSARADAAEVEALPVRAGHVGPFPQRLVRDDRHRRADRAHRPHRRAEGVAHLVGMRRAHLAAQDARELLLVELLVAADQREHRPGRPNVEQALDRLGGLDPSSWHTSAMVRTPGVATSPWCASPDAAADGFDRASSTLAA
jgi:hypothetical protein